ncbi:MAG: isopeptide-forming domain-containing fimbrial protein [Bacilli bacterium]|nr:isopeptide-forming domain-containing fimbrial protein [Bacilli bacterium]
MKKIKSLVITLIFMFGLFLAIPNVNAAQEVYFEKVGRYDFATAGNTLAKRASSATADYSSVRLINDTSTSYPANWSTISQKIPQNIKSRINNMSGALLSFPTTAKVQKAYLSTMIYNPTEIYDHETITTRPTTFDALVIDPDGNYKVYTDIYAQDGDIPTNVKSVPITVTKPGKYYVSILDLRVMPQQAWGISVIYQDKSIPYNYTKMIRVNEALCGKNDGTCNTTSTVKFNSKLQYLDRISIMGVITSAGSNAYTNPNSGTGHIDEIDTTDDKAWLTFTDNSTYQLYDRGDSHFTGRTETDFAKNIYKSTRYPNNVAGGEMDIFDEVLNRSSYGNNRTIDGLKFQKLGTSTYVISLVGMSIEIEAPKLKVTAKIEENDTGLVTNTAIFENTSQYNACNAVFTIPIDPKIENVRDITLSNQEGATVRQENDKIIITLSRQFKAKEKITVTYKADRKAEGLIYLKPEAEMYPASKDTCPEEITSNPNLKITDRDIVSIPAKYVINKNGKRVQKAEYKVGEQVTFEADQAVGKLGETIDSRYSKFIITDRLPEAVDYVSAKLYRESTEITDGTMHYDKSTHTLTWTASENFLKTMPLDNEVYTLKIVTKVNNNQPQIVNKVSTLLNDSSQDSNEVIVLVPEGVVVPKTAFNVPSYVVIGGIILLILAAGGVFYVYKGKDLFPLKK